MSGNNASGTSRHCPIKPANHFTCCGWPWVVPELVELIRTVLRGAPGDGYTVPKLNSEMRRELRRSSKSADVGGCKPGYCLDLQIPGPQHMSGILGEMKKRGLVALEPRDHKLLVRGLFAS